MPLTKRLTVAVATIACFVGIGVASIAPASAASQIRVVVNGEPITSNEIAERARLLRLTSRTSAASVERAATEELIEDKLKLQEGKRVGITINDQQVDAAFASIAGRLKISPAQLAQGLSQQGIGAKNLKERLRIQILWQQLVVGRFNRTVSISDSQIVDALAKKESSGKPAPTGDGKTAEYTLKQVVLVIPKGAGEGERMREAEARRARITSCDQLVEAVKPLREALVKNLGKRTEDELPEQFRGLLGDVAVGHLAKPLRTPIGVEMVAVCEKRDLSGDFSVRNKIEEELRQQEGEVFARRYINDLRRIAVIDYRK
ncbi:MAG: peptidylprolyl isomerase [Phyllobacteriaceae bacterium]|nr:peptidylprolyl isomerase [Phyllobacteriaceae bacterium]